MLLQNYKVAMSTLQEEDEMEELQNLSAHIAEDPNMQEFMVDEERDENKEDDLVLGPQTVFYSAQDVDDLRQEWLDMHRQEMIDLQWNMQMQLDAQAARSRAQINLGSTVQYPTTGATLMGQPGLSANAPAFLPGQGLPGIGTTFYSLTP